MGANPPARAWGGVGERPGGGAGIVIHLGAFLHSPSAGSVPRSPPRVGGIGQSLSCSSNQSEKDALDSSSVLRVGFGLDPLEPVLFLSSSF